MPQKTGEISLWLRGARAIVGGLAFGIPIAALAMGKFFLCPECDGQDPNIEASEKFYGMLIFLTGFLMYFVVALALANWMYDKGLYCIIRFHLRHKYSISDVLAEYKTSLGTEEDLTDYGKQLARQMEKMSWINSLDHKIRESRITTIKKAFN